MNFAFAFSLIFPLFFVLAYSFFVFYFLYAACEDKEGRSKFTQWNLKRSPGKMAGAGAGAGAGNFPSETYTHPSTTHLKYISTTRICTWTIHMAYVMKEEAEEQPSPFDRKFRKSLNYTRKIFPNILEKGAGMGSAVIHSVQQINEPYTKTNKFNWITLLGITIECSQDFPPFLDILPPTSSV